MSGLGPWSLVTPPSGLTPGPIIVGPGEGECGSFFMLQADFLALMDRLLPYDYIQPLKDPGPGYEVLQAYAKMFERISFAIGEFECESFIIFSHGGAYATATVEFYRDNATAGAFVVKQGTIVKTSKTNREYVLTEDVTFGALDLDQPASVRSVGQDPLFNVRGEVTQANGDILEGEIDTVVLPLEDPPLAERGLKVRQIGHASGALAAVLDQLGRDRSIDRLNSTEPDGNYKGRIRTLPDTVSLDAMRRQLDAIFVPIGETYDLIETWEERYQAYWDSPDAPISGSLFDPNLFCYDDPRPNPPFRNRWLDERDHRAAFIVVVPDVHPIEDYSFAYDDTGVVPADFTEPTGKRAHSAYDVPDIFDPTLMLAPAYDGEDVGSARFYLALIDILKKVKPAGADVAIELEGE